jgi:RNA recognition motif-containing protein
MKPQSFGRHSRHSRGGSRRRRGGRSRQQFGGRRPPEKKSLWQRFIALFSNGKDPSQRFEPVRNGAQPIQPPQPPRPPRKPESVEVTSPRLYVGNLSFDATESDLFELFNGVGQVQNAEVVTYKHNQRSKGFAFVQMLTIDEAKRAVAELHDKEFLGRKLVVSGAKTSEHRSEH